MTTDAFIEQVAEAMFKTTGIEADFTSYSKRETFLDGARKMVAANPALFNMPVAPQKFYVSLTWDDWPEGGSYGDVVLATTHDEAERIVRRKMAETRAEETLGDMPSERDDAEFQQEFEDEVSGLLEGLSSRWHLVDCFPVADFIERHQEPSA